MNKSWSILLVTSLISCVGKEEEIPMLGETKYEVTFTSTWSQKSHPTNYPSRPHFSGLIGSTHNATTVFWEEGNPPSPGIESMAETGSKSLLTGEIDAQIDKNNADQVISGSGHDAPDHVSVSFIANPNFSYMTLVSMVAPSPDWFVGVSGFPLRDAGGAWISEATISLHVYDAGSDDGKTFNASDIDKSPKGNIGLLTSDSGDTDFSDGLPIIGTFIIKQIK